VHRCQLPLWSFYENLLYFIGFLLDFYKGADTRAQMLTTSCIFMKTIKDMLGFEFRAQRTTDVACANPVLTKVLTKPVLNSRERL